MKAKLPVFFVARASTLVVILALLSACTRATADLKVETEHDCGDYGDAPDSYTRNTPAGSLVRVNQSRD